jgi:hypothetical protein
MPIRVQTDWYYLFYGFLHLGDLYFIFSRKQYTQSKIDDFMYILKIITLHNKRRCQYYLPLPTTRKKALQEA